MPIIVSDVVPYQIVLSPTLTDNGTSAIVSDYYDVDSNLNIQRTSNNCAKVGLNIEICGKKLESGSRISNIIADQVE